MFFISPTHGKLKLDEMFEKIVEFINDEPDLEYSLIIGCDSQARESDICFVTAVVIYRTGKGGRFFYRREYETINRSIRQRIFYETAKSLEIASDLTCRLAADEMMREHVHVEIHLDVGRNGKTKEFIKEVVGMVVGSGYDARIKPDSYGASKVADKYTR